MYHLIIGEYDMNPDVKNNKLKIMILFNIAIIIVVLVGVSYSFFRVQISDNTTSANIVVRTPNSKLVYSEGETINASNLKPGWIGTKTVMVENTSNEELYYNIFISVLVQIGLQLLPELFHRKPLTVGA